VRVNKVATFREDLEIATDNRRGGSADIAAAFGKMADFHSIE
jgi:hypothetical protein